MSLLEDVFLEDEAGEAQELERVIEGDEFDERPRTPDSNNDSEKEDEAEEDKRVVDHTAKAKRVVKNPRFVLNPARLTGPRGIQVLPEHFKDFKFKGKGHECEDLDIVLKKLEHWAYRLYPKFKFDDCLKKIETLGKKRPVMVHLHKIRTDQLTTEDTVVQQDSSGDEAAPEPPEDEFDRLLQQQIELARATPAPGSVRKEYTPQHTINRSPHMAPKAISSPSISDDQKERMIKNRKLAEERRLARLNLLNTINIVNDNENSSIEAEKEKAMEVVEVIEINDPKVNDDDVAVIRKHNRSNVIDSSDDESVVTVNESIKIDVHNVKNSDVIIVTGNLEENVDENETINVEIDSSKSKENENIDVAIDSKENEIEIMDAEIDSKDNDIENIEVQIDSKDKEVENIDVDIHSSEDIIVVESNEPEITHLSTNQAVLENDNHEIVEEDLPNDKMVLQNDTSLDKRELENDKKEISDNDGQESIKDDSKDKETETDKTVTEDLMDIDFSDDF